MESACEFLKEKASLKDVLKHRNTNWRALRVISIGLEPDMSFSYLLLVMGSTLLIPPEERPRNQGQWFTPLTMHGSRGSIRRDFHKYISSKKGNINWRGFYKDIESFSKSLKGYHLRGRWSMK
jgi:hypothetical protein